MMTQRNAETTMILAKKQIFPSNEVYSQTKSRERGSLEAGAIIELLTIRFKRRVSVVDDFICLDEVKVSQEMLPARWRRVAAIVDPELQINHVVMTRHSLTVMLKTINTIIISWL